MDRDKHSGKVLDGRYELIRLIDEGGMGAVYLGRHVKLGRRAAVKFLHGELRFQTTVVKRFYREAQAASAIDVGVAEWGEPYIVMEYLAGENLDSLLKRKGPIGLPAALGVMEPALRGLGAAHDHGVVHRDLKPENIFLSRPPDSPPQVKLIDFGISKFVESDLSKLTQTGTLLGTPSFMSPEQARGKGDFDHRSDIYAMGVILFLMLTGELPFVGESYNDLIITILTEPPRDPAAINPRFPAVIQPIIDKLLHKEPASRYGSCQALIEALEQLEGYEQRLDALTALTEDIPDDRFATGDLGPLVDGREDLAATVFAEMGREESGVSPTDDTIPPPGETISLTFPGEPVDRRGHSGRPILWMTIALVVLGGLFFFFSDEILSSVKAPDAPDAEVQQIKDELAQLQSAANRSPAIKPSPPATPAEPSAGLSSKQDSAAPSDTGDEGERDSALSMDDSKAALPAPAEDTDTEMPERADPSRAVDDSDADAPPGKGSDKAGETKAEAAPLPPPEKTAPPPPRRAHPEKTASPEEAAEPPKPPLEPVALTADDVDRLVESKSSAIESCYDSARRADPAISGKLVVKVTVSDNRVWPLITENELTPEMGRCVINAIRAITPPPTVGSITILKEILFRVRER
jgi:serine/threonine protein kinase